MTSPALGKETWTIRDRATGERRTVLVIHYSGDAPAPPPAPVVDVSRYCLSTSYGETCWFDADHQGAHRYALEATHRVGEGDQRT